MHIGFQRPKITHHPESIAVIAAGQTAELKCEASGKPAPNFQWWKTGCDEALADSDDVTIKTGNGHSTLTINNIQKSDAGQYNCKASSLFSCWDDISNNATITVAGELSMSSLYRVEHSILSLGPPTIIHDPEAVNETSGSKASFTCVASSDLPIKFSWQKEGSGTIFSSCSTVDQSGKISTLTLNPVSTTHTGSYTCTASNDAGSVTSNAATLQVTGEYMNYSTVFTLIHT